VAAATVALRLAALPCPPACCGWGRLYVALSDFRRQHRRSMGGPRAGARRARVSMARAATEAGGPAH